MLKDHLENTQKGISVEDISRHRSRNQTHDFVMVTGNCIYHYLFATPVKVSLKIR